VARLSTDAEAATKFVPLLLTFGTSTRAAEGSANAFLRDSNSRQSGGYHVSEPSLGPRICRVRLVYGDLVSFLRENAGTHLFERVSTLAAPCLKA